MSAAFLCWKTCTPSCPPTGTKPAFRTAKANPTIDAVRVAMCDAPCGRLASLAANEQPSCRPGGRGDPGGAVGILTARAPGFQTLPTVRARDHRPFGRGYKRGDERDHGGADPGLA